MEIIYSDCPVLWIRLEPDMRIICDSYIQQPDFKWHYQMKYERDVVAQFDAIEASKEFPSLPTYFAMLSTMNDCHNYWKVRCAAALSMTCVANKISNSFDATLTMVKSFKHMFYSKSCPRMVRVNNFKNFEQYFIQKVLPLAISGLRNPFGACPKAAVDFIFTLLKYNNNLHNLFSDAYYKAALVDALANTLIQVEGYNASKVHHLTFSAKEVLEQVTHCLNLDINRPGYKKIVTISCLKAIHKLQSYGSIPLNSDVFYSHAEYGQYVEVRIAALECLVDLVKIKQTWNGLMHLINILESDPDRRVRYTLAQFLIKNPPFNAKLEQGRSNCLNRVELVERLWTIMNTKCPFDCVLRSYVVDFYNALYGKQLPYCMLSVQEKETETNKLCTSEH